MKMFKVQYQVNRVNLQTGEASEYDQYEMRIEASDVWEAMDNCVPLANEIIKNWHDEAYAYEIDDIRAKQIK